MSYSQDFVVELDKLKEITAYQFVKRLDASTTKKDNENWSEIGHLSVPAYEWPNSDSVPADEEIEISMHNKLNDIANGSKIEDFPVKLTYGETTSVNVWYKDKEDCGYSSEVKLILFPDKKVTVREGELSQEIKELLEKYGYKLS